MDDENSLSKKTFIINSIEIIGFVIVYFLLVKFSDPTAQPNSIIVDLLFAGFGLVLWLVFFSQFVLPVRTLDERTKVLDRIFGYFTGSRGPAYFIQNGINHAGEKEKKRRGKGVIWLDNASAVMLRTATTFTEARGPGLVFTKRGEYIAGTVDLHLLKQFIGPRPDEKPFDISKDTSDNDPVQKRRWETSGMTRDGIEVVATLSITYKIDALEHEGNTPFGFNRDSVFRAVRDSLIAGSSPSQPVWNPLIAKMAVDIWREYLRKFTLDQLFELFEGGEGSTLQSINRLLRERLCLETVPELDEFGRLTGRTIPCDEYNQITKMGWRIISVNLFNLAFSQEVEERLISQWKNTWLQNAQKERNQVNTNRNLNETRGQEDAEKFFGVAASIEIANVEPENKIHALELLTSSTCSSLPPSIKRELDALRQIQLWCSSKRGTQNDVH